MYEPSKRRTKAPKDGDRLRRQIALEAARRMYAAIGPRDDRGHLGEATEAEYYAAKRKAAAVLGHRVRPGDLPSDSEIREQVLALARSRGAAPEEIPPEPDTEGGLAEMADHLDRFAIYRMRLLPLESVKQPVKTHPEGDALYHSLQVFELAREARPYDEEFLLAALLHDVGKAIDPQDHVAAGLDALRGTLTERTAWLIAHHMDLLALRDRSPDARARRALEESEYYDDLVQLRELDDAGRVPGAPVGTVDQALDYLRGLEAEDYLVG
jgi:predicted HD phosphohydrolase